ncbi:hypothetical protein [Streptomyces platensis]|uniref:hypothetical protein n=1 Tax=Streptomyces platensis TaxID=58346 RepID=UPI0036851843
MTGDEPFHALARGDGDGLLHHLLVDQAIKVALVLVALLVLALGMRLIWKKAGRAGPPRCDDR